MSKEKKLKGYVEGRLSAYSGAEDSLTRLKREQEGTASRKEGHSSRKGYFRRIAVTLSAVVAVVIVAVLVNFLPSMDKESADYREEGFSVVEKNHHGDPARSSAKENDVYGDRLLADVNDETTYLRILLPERVSSRQIVADGGSYYLLTSEDGSFEGIVVVESFTPEGTQFKTDRESSIAGMPFEYAMVNDKALRGKIETDRERIYLSYCTGENEEAILSSLREIIVEK